MKKYYVHISHGDHSFSFFFISSFRGVQNEGVKRSIYYPGKIKGDVHLQHSLYKGLHHPDNPLNTAKECVKLKSKVKRGVSLYSSVNYQIIKGLLRTLISKKWTMDM